MAELKLAKLSDRTPVKLAIAITPDLQNALRDYAAIYAQAYGIEEPVVELRPAARLIEVHATARRDKSPKAFEYCFVEATAIPSLLYPVGRQPRQAAMDGLNCSLHAGSSLSCKPRFSVD